MTGWGRLTEYKVHPVKCPVSICVIVFEILSCLGCDNTVGKISIEHVNIFLNGQFN